MEKSIQELLNFSIINIDKPTGPTSFTVSDFVRKKLKLNKTSHFGTLDPMVTGVLPIALGRACKLTGFFLGHDKEYVGIMKVHKDIGIKDVQKIINEKFLGKIMQLPPKKSRVKRQIREREVISWDLIEQEGRNILFRASVQGGTYIRKLISDLGELIGGAHMAELRRVRAGVFTEPAINLYDFEKAVDEYKSGKENLLHKMLTPAEEGIKKILLTGKPIFKEDILSFPKDDTFAVFFGEKFVGIYRKVKDESIVAKAEFVYN
jgi:H/ACA ribonucleoprotein complex subunit 4